MNGTAQRQRHVAIATAEKRIDDTQLGLELLAAEVVKDQARITQHRAFLANHRRALTAIEARLDALEAPTRWQRFCRWITALGTAAS
jgi:hypothetical protein